MIKSTIVLEQKEDFCKQTISCWAKSHLQLVLIIEIEGLYGHTWLTIIMSYQNKVLSIFFNYSNFFKELGSISERYGPQSTQIFPLREFFC